MKVAFHLRRRPVAEIATAVLLETDRVEVLIGLAARLGPGPTPPIYRVAGGFLVGIGEGAGVPGGAIRLRRLAGNLYLPVDADLVPGLLDEEASGLTRDLGLVFLPGGRILGFEPGRPVALASLLVAPRHPRRDWRPFPDRPDRVERIGEIGLELPGDSPGSEDATGGVGADGPPRPEESGAAATMAARAAVGAGKGLVGLGGLLGIKAMADLGARWIEGAVARVPRLTEAILGRQEGALRELLRQFRDGDVERALRHALPLGADPGRGGVPASDARLPEIDPSYSLRALLGSGRGARSLWFGDFDLQAALAGEYRKAAEDAERRGDFRRAAYIHGRLLDDAATAAHILTRGGLHHDAAILHLERLEDIPAAARAFEAAGECDRALRLYRQSGRHAEAGDLLRRLGEDEAAVEEYVFAADLLVAGPNHGSIAAGDLLRDRARRPDLAAGHYARGWGARPSANAVPCALRLAALLADRGESRAILAIVDEADALFGRPGQDTTAAEFYNAMARLADRDELAEGRDDLRDRALIGLAAKLRQAVGAGGRAASLASAFLGRPGAWPADVVGDADRAARAEADRESARRRLAESGSGSGPSQPARVRRFDVLRGTVTAACHAVATGEVFLGYATGEVFRVDFARGEVARVGRDFPPVVSLAVDAEGRDLVMLAGEGEGRKRLVRWSRAPGSADWDRQLRMVDGPGEFWLTPVLGGIPGSATVGVWDGEEMVLMGGADGLAMIRRVPLPSLKTEPQAALLIGPDRPGDPPTILIHDGPDITHVNADGSERRRRFLGWRPTLPEGHALRSVPLSSLRVAAGRLELAGLDREGAVHWTSLKIDDAELIRASNNMTAGEPAFVAATLVRPGLLAAVSPAGVTWLRCGPRSCARAGSVALPVPSALACFPAHRAGELVIVCGDGSLACVRIPA